MTSSNLHVKTNTQRHWLNIAQLLLFTSAIILLSVLSFFYRPIEIKRFAILIAASLLALFNFEKIRKISIIQKIIVLYIIEMFFNQLLGKVFHIQSFSISLPLIAIVPLAASFIFRRFRPAKNPSAGENDFLKSWAVVFAVIVLHMLFLFLPLKQIYGYGYDHNFAVLANMCLYFLVFVFSWEQLESIHLRRIAAIVLTVFFIVIMVKGL